MIEFLLAAALAAQTPDTILPGSADLPVLRGSESIACPDLSSFGEDFTPKGPRQCVEASYDDTDRLADAYVAALRSSGWRLAGGAGVQYWIQRIKQSGDCEQIALTALPGEVLGRPADTSVLMFEYKASIRCLDARP